MVCLLLFTKYHFIEFSRVFTCALVNQYLLNFDPKLKG